MLIIESADLLKIKKAVKGKLVFTYGEETYFLSENKNHTEVSLMKRIPTNSTGQFEVENINTVKGTIPTLKYSSRRAICYSQVDLDKLVHDLTAIGLIGGYLDEEVRETLRKQRRLEKAIAKQETLLAQEEEMLKELQKSIEKRKSTLARKKFLLEEIVENH